jgi:hypothetical protein
MVSYRALNFAGSALYKVDGCREFESKTFTVLVHI